MPNACTGKIWRPILSRSGAALSLERHYEYYADIGIKSTLPGISTELEGMKSYPITNSVLRITARKNWLLNWGPLICVT